MLSRKFLSFLSQSAATGAVRRGAVSVCLALGLLSPGSGGLAQEQAPVSVPAMSAPGVPFTPEALAKLLPATVYFEGKTAPLQLRNAGAVRFGSGAIVWMALVDSSGYASDVQQKYAFYLVAEDPLRIGAVLLPAGAYGGGFLGDHFVLMDLGGHTVATGPTNLDPELKRPRPLQLLPFAPDAVKLYLGRRWIPLRRADGTAP